jgi:crossover junction endodeoxyribonuclease RuvC
MTILGIDPGMHETGWAVVDGSTPAAPRLVASGVIRTQPGVPTPERLVAIHQELSEVIREHGPKACAVEEMFFVKEAHTVRATLQARGVVMLAVAQAGHKVHEYNPKTVKSTVTGSGSAQKAQVQSMVQKALKLAEPLRPNDVADAAAIAICHIRAGRVKGLHVLDSWGGRK